MSMIKSPEEILNIMTAAAMGDEVFRHILGFIEPGMTDQMVADEIDRSLDSLGSEGLAFPTICVSGSRGDAPHGEPSDKVIAEGEFITMDFGGIYHGYCGDMTRTVAVGDVTDEMQLVYEVVLEAQVTTLDMLRAGVRCFDADKNARDIITEAGYGEYYIHGTGHGVGREVHESPTLNTRSDEMLEVNMPVTVEPGIYIPGRFGVRIEDLAIITEFGIINAVHSPKELIIL